MNLLSTRIKQNILHRIHLLRSSVFVILLFNTACQIHQNNETSIKKPFVIKNSEEKLFSFAVIADAQWADKDEQWNRHYREALDKMKECVNDLNKKNLLFTIQVGDIIDGRNSVEKTQNELDKIVEVYNKLNMPHYSVIGNHDVIAKKEYLMKKLKMEKPYYDFSFFRKARGWRFVVLDGMDDGNENIGEEQLKWLKKTLDYSTSKEEKVIVFNHFALLEKAAKNHRLKNPDAVLELIEKYPCVTAYFAGHDHAGGYALQNNIHHVTFKGMVEAPIKNAYAVIDVYPTKIVKRGFGKEPSRELKLNIPQLLSPLEKKWKSIPALTDEFNEDKLDAVKWYDHNPEWKGRRPGFFSKDNVSVSDGKLHLTAKAEDLPNLPKDYHTFTTAAVQSKTRVKYGYFETKCKPMKSKASSAFWFYYNEPDYWTEIDVFEICGKSDKEERIYHMNAHVFVSPTFRWKDSIKNRLQYPASWNTPFKFVDKYHIYGLEWTKEYLKWYVDGKLIRVMKNLQWHQALTLNFDSETFPHWFGLPDKKNLPSTFSIEYVRAWKPVSK